MVRSYPVGMSIGGALLAVFLVTGCGAGDGDAAASPSGVASPSSEPGVSSEPSPGSSSEPEGTATSAEYVPASLEGPAQNVPKPVMPELAEEESREGAQAFLDYWSDAMWYAYQTGDTSYAREIISPHCAVCMDQLSLIEEIYKEGLWAIGGRESVVVQESSLVRASDGVYKPIVRGSTEGAKLVENGKVTLDVPPNAGGVEPFIIYLDFQDGKWVYISAANLPGADPHAH